MQGRNVDTGRWRLRTVNGGKSMNKASKPQKPKSKGPGTDRMSAAESGGTLVWVASLRLETDRLEVADRWNSSMSSI